MVPQTDLPVCASLHSAHPPLSRKYDDKSFVFVRPTSLLLWSWPAGQLWILLCEEGNSTPDQDVKPSPCFFFQSVTAALIASSARTEQWIFTGGRLSSLTISVFLIARASSRVLPLTHSVARLELAIALPQPNVLNLASSMSPDSSLTLI